MSEEFQASWTAEVLRAAPMIAPARQFTYPFAIPGEEDALARGALQVNVRPRVGGLFLASFALGFRDPSMPTGVFRCPAADQLCAVAGGYAYVLDTTEPGVCTLLDLKPVTAVRAIEAAGLLLFSGFQTLQAWGMEGLRWKTGRLSWEGVTLGECSAEQITGTGWDLMSDRDVPFTVDTRTGAHTGGASPGGFAAGSARS